MVVPRLMVYGTLILLATLVLCDTNLGWTVTETDHSSLRVTASYLENHGFRDDACAVRRMIVDSSFRTSHFFQCLGQIAAARGAGFAYYAYTPLLSESRIFLGENFWETGQTGRASILVHELAHVRYHRRNTFRGLPRDVDEAQAYERQYVTCKALGLTQTCTDSTVYWDMMVGINMYLISLKPAYARRADIAGAARLLSDEREGCSMTDVAIYIGFIFSALLVLVVGDRLGGYLSCVIFGRCRQAPLLHLGPWILPFALLVPGVIILGFFTVCMKVHPRSAIELLADNLEFLVLATFFLTGLTGGFFTRTRR